MGRRSYPGGIISGAEPVANGAGASGMWTLQTAAQKKTADEWPIRGVNAVISNTAPVIGNVAVTDSGYNVLNDTPYLSTTGGFIRITGANFATGAVVYVGGSAAVTTSFVSSTELRAQIGAGSSNTVPVYVVNSDNGTGIKLAAVTYSGTPAWSTAATLSFQTTDSAFSVNLSATSDSAIVYTLDTGSSLPPGTSLFSNGVFAGTVANTSITVDTAYSFSVVANDAENQDSSRTFTVTVVLGDPFFYLTPLLLKGDTGNNWISDASTNKYILTIVGDTRPVAFSPYVATNWSGYFDGSGDFLTIGNNSLLTFGTSAYTIEFWYFGDPSIADYRAIISNGGNFAIYFISSAIQLWNAGNPVFQASMTVPRNKWTFIQIIRTSTASNGLVFYLDGVAAATGTDGTNWTATGTTYFFNDGVPRTANGYVTDVRVSVVARTPGRPTAPLASDANTRLLTLQNRRFIDNGPNASTVTPSGDAAIKTFNPYTITETDTTTGSGYFDGTGDYLSIGTAANWVSLHNTAAQWTMDFWVYPITYNGSLLETCDSSTQIGIFLGLTAGGLVVLQIMRGVTSSFVMNVTGSVVVAKNAWSHIQISYDYNLASDNVAIYINGTVNTASAGSFTKTANAPSSSNPTSPLYVGYSSASQFQGYITDLRIRTGIAVSSAPTLPTTSVAIDANTQLLTLQYRQGENNHRFVDEAGPKAVITRVGNASQGSFSPYSQQGWSVSFDGSTSYLNATIGTLSGTWTVEFWVNMPTLGVQYTFANFNIGSTAGINIWRNTSNQLVVDDGANAQTAFSTVTFATAAVWYHVAVTRDGTTTRGYINGVLAGTNTFTPTSVTAVTIGRYNSPTAYLLGYISNFRVVNGTVLYTAAFTPPATSLPAVAGTMLLTCQSNRFIDTTGQGIVVTPNGSPKVQAVSPFRAFTNNVYNPAYSPLLHGGSVYFDGSGDYINIANSGAATLFTNDHTIEFWMYPDGTQAQYAVVWQYSTGSASGAANTYYFSIGSNSNDASLLLGPLSGSWALQITILTAEYVKILNNWTHVVITRSGTAFRIFFNGVLRAYGTSASSITAQSASFVFGWDGSNATTVYKGWISDFRIINGSVPTAYQTAATALSTSVFTPPSAPVTAEANTVIRSTFINSGIHDAGGRVNLETIGDARVTNAQNKFGGSSLYFDGTGDYLRLPILQQYNFGTGDFTFECWVYMNSYNATSGSQLFGGHVFGSSADYIWFIDSTGKVGLQITASTSGRIISTSSVPLTTWTHIAVVRASGTVTPYINGTNAGGAASYTTAMPITTVPTIGSDSTGNAGFSLNGYIDDLRISRYARYTANFTAPTTAFLTK